MLTRVRLPPGTPAKCCGLLRKALTNTKGSHTTQSYCHQTNNATGYKYYLRSSYSLIHHYYNDLGTIKDAQDFVKKFPKLKRRSPSQLDSVVKVLKDGGHCWKEVELFKEVMLYTPSQYTHRVQLLESLSMLQPSLYHILWMTQIMEKNVKSLREEHKSVLKSDPIESLIASATDLKLPPSIMQAARDQFSGDDSVTPKQVFLFFLKHYLAQRFSEDPNMVESFLYSIRGSYLWHPLHHYPLLCDLFIDCLKLSFSEVKKQPHLFHLDPANTRMIVRKYPRIGGTPTREVAKTVPKLFQISADDLFSWLTLLHTHKVHTFVCTHHTPILFNTSSFSEVNERLKILTQFQEWEVIMVSDKLFEILRSQERIKRLLNTIGSGETISSLHQAINPVHSTKRSLCRSVTPEVVSYVATTLGLPAEEIREVLEEEIYTVHGIMNTTTVLRLLLDYGFTREQVLAGAMVLNMDAGIVEQVLKDLHNRPEAQPFAEWMENPFVLHLLAYCIKKDFPHMDIHRKN